MKSPHTRNRLRASPSNRRVALLIESSNAYGRGLLEGVVGFVRENGPWSLYWEEQSRRENPPLWLEGWTGDGIIARIESPTIAAAVLAAGCPTVDASAGRLAPTLPWVETDDAAIARLASEHLLGRGFRRFAYCGDATFAWSKLRAKAFQEIISRTGFPCLVYSGPMKSEDPSHRKKTLRQWLKKLQKPVGIFACYDILGQEVLDACRENDLSVPEEVAVIGVDDDALLCELCTPPLSSVIPNAYRAGYEAAALLARLMRGERNDTLEHLIPPVGVKQRQSTNILATEDSQVAKALRYIREHACDPIDVNDVVRIVSLSRRILEKRFSKQLNRTPHEEILHVRLGRVRQLLTETNLSIEEIAERTGFEHPEYLSVVFKREISLSPGAFRRQLTKSPPV